MLVVLIASLVLSAPAVAGLRKSGDQLYFEDNLGRQLFCRQAGPFDLGREPYDLTFVDTVLNRRMTVRVAGSQFGEIVDLVQQAARACPTLPQGPPHVLGRVEGLQWIGRIEVVACHLSPGEERAELVADQGQGTHHLNLVVRSHTLTADLEDFSAFYLLTTGPLQ